MLRYLSALTAGGLFGAGLLISGMTDTAKVQGWLDIFGAWDPTLAFVMGGAVLPMMLVWRGIGARKTALLGNPMPDPFPPVLDRNLILGSVLFGLGWGIAGLCPGPALAILGFGGADGALFMPAMIAGMALHPPVRAALDRLDQREKPAQER